LMAEEASAPFARILCVHGNCFVRQRGSSTVYPVPVGEYRSVEQGDVAISVGYESRVEITFEDKTKVYLRDSGLYRIRKGEKDVLLAQGNETESSQKGFNPEDDVDGKGNLLYVGDLPLKFLTPKFGEKFVFTSFPQSIRVAFELNKNQVRMEKLEDLRLWQLIRLDESTKPEEPMIRAENLGSFEFSSQTAEAGMLNYFADVTIPRDGAYLLLPEAEYRKGEYSGVRLQVGGREALKQSIRDMLQGAAENPDAGVEVRGN